MAYPATTPHHDQGCASHIMEISTPRDQRTLSVGSLEVESSGFGSPTDSPSSLTPLQRRRSSRFNTLTSVVPSSPSQLRIGADIGKAEALAVVREDGLSLRCLPECMRGNRDIVREAVKQNVDALEFATKVVLQDMELLSEAVERDGLALQHVPKEMRDQCLVGKAIEENGCALQYAPRELRADASLVIKAIEQDGQALRYASKHLRKDKNFALQAVTVSGTALAHVEESFCSRDLVLAAVRSYGGALRHAPSNFREDPIIALAAVEQHAWAMQFVSHTIITESLFRDAFEINPEVVQYVDIMCDVDEGAGRNILKQFLDETAKTEAFCRSRDAERTIQIISDSLRRFAQLLSNDLLRLVELPVMVGWLRQPSFWSHDFNVFRIRCTIKDILCAPVISANILAASCFQQLCDFATGRDRDASDFALDILAARLVEWTHTTAENRYACVVLGAAMADQLQHHDLRVRDKAGSLCSHMAEMLQDVHSPIASSKTDDAHDDPLASSLREAVLQTSSEVVMASAASYRRFFECVLDRLEESEAMTALEFELNGCKPSELRKRSRQMGLGVCERENAENSENPKDAFIKLIMDKARANSVMTPKTGDPVTSHSALQSKRPAELRKHAKGIGVDKSAREEAENSHDPKEEYIRLIEERDLAKQNSPSLLARLSALSPVSLSLASFRGRRANPNDESAPSDASVPSTLKSQRRKRAVKITQVAREELAEKLTDTSSGLSDGAKLEQFVKTLSLVVDLVFNACGGCGFVITTKETLRSLQENLRVDFQVGDRDTRFPDGYMTNLLRDVHVSAPAFQSAVQEFTSEGFHDKWPEGHIASGLPKDGFFLVSTSGYRHLCAARLVGLPPSPFKWDGVGTRHMAALAMSWALRGSMSVVIVRSDSGRVHGLISLSGEATVIFAVEV